jgi:hypothetical protein
MSPYALDQQLRAQLLDIPEIAACGFSVREGLTGAGVTILKGRAYFGSWRATQGQLVFVSASINEPHHFVDSPGAAARHTLLLILKTLQVSKNVQPSRAMAG